MPESGPYGSVRGALSNERPYRDPQLPRFAFRFYDVGAQRRAASASDALGETHTIGRSTAPS